MNGRPGGYRPTEVLVDLDAIRYNLRALRPKAVSLLAIVKADAYGHGARAVAQAASDAGADRLGVALVEEGIELRDGDIGTPILVLSEFPRGSEPDALAAGLDPTVCSAEGLAALAAGADRLRRDRASVRVHLKVDTGMHRNGVWPPEASAALADDVVDAGFTLEGVWTHLARAEDDEGTTKEQLRRFEDAVAQLSMRPPILHVANSAATILHPSAHFDLVRPGIALYGIEPAPGIGSELGLRPALSWRSCVASTRRLPAGEALSYGHRYRLERESTIATVPVGYADGYPRSLFPSGDVLVGGVRRRIAGSVTMDQILLDCGDADVRPGEEVVLIGSQGDERITANELADRAGTIGYEIVTGVGQRVPRRFLSSGNEGSA